MPDFELDGVYQVTSTSSYEGPLKKKSDGITEIRNGKTSRVDENGVKWNSTFTILNDSEVEMVATADPGDANIDFALIAPDGTPTLEPISYRSVMKYARKGDKIQLSGRIEYGDEIVLLTMRKVDPV